MSRKSTSLETVARFQSEVATLRGEPEPLAMRLTLYTITALTVVTMLMLFVAKVDRVVSSTGGKVVSTVSPEIFQSLDPAIIKSIDVKEGEHVAQGQVLATLDATFAGADVNQLSLQVASLDAQLARADAEQEGRDPIFVVNDDPDRRRYSGLQLGLFNQRAAQLQAQLTSYDQRVDQTLATIHKLESDEARLQEREKIAEQVEGMRTTLLEKGAGSLLNQLASKDQRIEQMRSLENEQNSLIESKHQLSSLRADRESFVQQWRTDLSKEVVTARNARDTALAQLEKAKRHQDLVRLVAKDDSVVLTVAKLSVGSVVREGDPLVTVVPLGAPLEAEIRIGARDVGFLRPGDRATLKIDAFDYVEHGTAQGVVKWISEGAFTTNDDTNQPIDPYYRARVSIDDLHLIGVPQNFRLIPGMTLSADINVGRRSLGAYLLQGFIKGAGGAMREP